MEVESALVARPFVAEVAVVGRPHPIKGEAITAFVTLEGGTTPTPRLRQELANHVVCQIGVLARPEDTRFADALPKTRSGKLMRLLRELAAGADQVTDDVTTLKDLSVLARLRAAAEDER